MVRGQKRNVQLSRRNLKRTRERERERASRERTFIGLQILQNILQSFSCNYSPTCCFLINEITFQSVGTTYSQIQGPYLYNQSISGGISWNQASRAMGILGRMARERFVMPGRQKSRLLHACHSCRKASYPAGQTREKVPQSACSASSSATPGIRGTLQIQMHSVRTRGGFWCRLLLWLCSCMYDQFAKFSRYGTNFWADWWGCRASYEFFETDPVHSRGEED